MKSRKTVLVTGGAGFIGSHLCDWLVDQGHHVVCLDSMLTGRLENLRRLLPERRFDLIERDVIDAPPVRLKPDRIYHLACAASPPQYQADPVHTMLTCVVGGRNYLELARSSGARFVLTSTSEVYGDPEVHPQAEHYRGAVNIIGPRACYDEGKRAAESLASDYHRVWSVDVRIARIFNTYGPRMRRDDGRVISNFVTQALAGEPLTIYGDGSQTRSFCYVDDMIRALILLGDSERAGPQPINLGNPSEFTVRELAELVLELCGSRKALRSLPLPPDDPRRRRPEISRAQKLLGWTPRTPLREGLKSTIVALSEELDAAEAILPGPTSARRRLPARGEARIG